MDTETSWSMSKRVHTVLRWRLQKGQECQKQRVYLGYLSVLLLPDSMFYTWRPSFIENPSRLKGDIDKPMETSWNLKMSNVSVILPIPASDCFYKSFWYLTLFENSPVSIHSLSPEMMHDLRLPKLLWQTSLAEWDTCPVSDQIWKTLWLATSERYLNNHFKGYDRSCSVRHEPNSDTCSTLSFITPRCNGLAFTVFGPWDTTSSRWRQYIHI